MKQKTFFTTGKHNGHSCFIDGSGNPFISIGLNHTDETNMLFPYNIDIWREHYGSHEAWLRNGVVADLKRWNFNTIGWVQDIVSLHRMPYQTGCTHSHGYSYEDYEICDMPYCVNLEVAKIANWDPFPLYPDVFTDGFEQWCDYLARYVCSRHKDNTNLIGYFFADIPSWQNHPSGETFPQLKGLKEGTAEYNEMLEKITERYYSVMVSKIRQYDPNHLILGDRFNGNCPDSDIVYSVAARYCDVISIQYFLDGDRSIDAMEAYFDRINRLTGKPILLADIGNKCPTELNPDNDFGPQPLASQEERAKEYTEAIGRLINKDYLVGWHWCAYVENPYRGWGMKSHLDEDYRELTEPITEFNARISSTWRR